MHFSRVWSTRSSLLNSVLGRAFRTASQAQVSGRRPANRPSPPSSVCASSIFESSREGKVAASDDEPAAFSVTPLSEEAPGPETQHRDVSGGRLRPAVFGAMDGLVTNVSLIAGVSGGGVVRHAVILSGWAGLVAGAFSMATGEFTSVKSQNEMVESEVAVEREGPAANPREERAELAASLVQRGVAPALTEEVAAQMSGNPDEALRFHALEELGVDPVNLRPRTRRRVCPSSPSRSGRPYLLCPFF